MSESSKPYDQDRSEYDRDIDKTLDLLQSSKAARNLIEPGESPARLEAQARPSAEKTKRPEVKSKKFSTAKKVGATIAIAGAVAAGAKLGPEIVDYLDGPEISDKTIEYVVQDGDTAWSIFDQIEGIEAVNKQDVIYEVGNLPENQDISLGQLKPGDVITLPESVDN